MMKTFLVVFALCTFAQDALARELDCRTIENTSGRLACYAVVGVIPRLSAVKGAFVARETIYIVQAFNAGKGGHLKPDSPIACKTESAALRTAERLALSKLAVVAFSSSGDPEMGDYDDEPTVIFRKGELPAAFN